METSRHLSCGRERELVHVNRRLAIGCNYREEMVDLRTLVLGHPLRYTSTAFQESREGEAFVRSMETADFDKPVCAWKDRIHTKTGYREVELNRMGHDYEYCTSDSLYARRSVGGVIKDRSTVACRGR